MIRELYAYREMIFSLVRRYLKGRYKGSFLGFFWTFLNPLLQLAVYTMVFSVILRNGREDYYLFLFVALVPWIFCSSCASSGVYCIWQQQDMVKKIYFPREVIPISYVTSCFVNMLLSFIVVIAVALVTGVVPTVPGLLCLPLIMIVEYLMALGIALIVSSLTVYLRDLEHILGIIAMAWQFATPICYQESLIPARIYPYYNLNPMTPVVRAYRSILYEASVPDVGSLSMSVVFGVAFLIVGTVMFRHLQKRFAEEL